MARGFPVFRSSPGREAGAGTESPLNKNVEITHETKWATESVVPLQQITFVLDGYNVIGTLRGQGFGREGSLAAGREKLLRWVSLLARRCADVQVVFDGTVKSEERRHRVALHFTEKGRKHSADRAIWRLVHRDLAHQAVVVVSADKKVISGNHKKALAVWSPADFKQFMMHHGWPP